MIIEVGKPKISLAKAKNKMWHDFAKQLRPHGVPLFFFFFYGIVVVKFHWYTRRIELVAALVYLYASSMKSLSES